MKVTETPIVVTLEPEYETQYQHLMNEYFMASERNSRASSIQEKKQLMAVKEQMALLCNRNPRKLDMLKAIVKQVRDVREKALVITRSNAVAAFLLEQLSADEDTKGVLLITPEMSVHEVNQMVDRYNKVPDSTVMLVTDSMNTGLDFTAANHLVHYDYPLRYADILQRNNRITRQTTQHAEAGVYYLMTDGKIDEFDYRECMNMKRTAPGVRSTV